MLGMLFGSAASNCSPFHQGPDHILVRDDEGAPTVYGFTPRAFMAILDDCDFDALENMAACSLLLHRAVSAHLKALEALFSLPDPKGFDNPSTMLQDMEKTVVQISSEYP